MTRHRTPLQPAVTPSTRPFVPPSGILEIMDDKELEGVLAHEMGHVKNYDIRVTMIAFALSSVISLFADLVLRLTSSVTGRYIATVRLYWVLQRQFSRQSSRP